MNKSLAFIAGIVCCAISFPTLFFSKKDIVDEGFGLDEPTAGQPIWTFHHLKDWVVEWVRRVPQRAAKFFSFLSVMGLGVAILVWVF
jgi:hypothetical protein